MPPCTGRSPRSAGGAPAFRQYIEGNGSLKSRLHPVYPVDRVTLDPATSDVVDSLALLRQLHVGRNHHPIAKTITVLRDAVRAHAGISLADRRAGPRQLPAADRHGAPFISNRLSLMPCASGPGSRDRPGMKRLATQVSPPPSLWRPSFLTVPDDDQEHRLMFF